MASPSSDFSALRAAKHVGLTLLAAILFGGVLAGLNLFADSEKAADELGKQLVWVAVFAFVASYGAQTRRRAVFYGASTVVVALGLLVPIFLAWIGMRVRSNLLLTTEERAAPSLREGRLCQDALSFSVTKLGESFGRDTEAEAMVNHEQEKAAGYGNMVRWVWSANQKGERFMLSVAKGAANTPKTFARFTAGVRASAVETEGIEIEKEEAATEAAPYSYQLAVRRSDGFVIDIHCLSPAVPIRTSPVVCAITFAPSHESLREARQSLRFGPCG